MSLAEDLSTNSVSTSTELLRRVAKCDQAAWGTFFRLYRGLILSRCRSMGVRPCDCEDIVQSVLERVHRAIPEFRRECDGQGLRRWLRSITRNVIIDYFRSLPSEKTGYSQAELAEIMFQVEQDHSLVACTDDAETFVATELRPIVELVKLDYERRTWDAFWRTAVEGERSADVASDLQISMGTIRQARHKILKHLRRELSDLNEML